MVCMQNLPKIYQQDEVQNFRDCGGWRTVHGRTIAPGRLLRSGHWADANAEAFAWFAELSPTILVDLRRPSERATQPNQLPPASPPITQINSGGGDMSEAPHVQFLRQGNLTKQSVQAYMQRAYRRIPFEAHHGSLFRQTILGLAGGQTVLIHCAAGKDRTGILAALILLLLEVPLEHVMADYMATNQAVQIDQILPKITKKIEQKLQQSIPKGALHPMLGVTPAFLHEALDVIGDPMEFATQHLNVSRADIDRLRGSLVQ